jgi:hypothetical protein
MTTKLALQKIVRGILHTEDEKKHNHEKMWIIESQETANKQSESTIELVTHMQTLTQQIQLNGRNHYIPLNINTEC